jgi:hypothetical protein
LAQPIQSAQKYYPQIDKSVPAKVTVHLQRLYAAINDHDQAIVTLNGKVTGTAATATKSSAGAASASTFATTVINQVGVSSFNTLSGAVNYFPNLGLVNPQPGVTAYTTQQSDAGQEIVLNSALPIAVTLNFNVTLPWFATLTNQGSGTATLTPSSGTINGGASFALLSNYTSLVTFDGTNWWASALPVVPVNTPAVSYEWLKAYNAATGVFTQTQPAFSDISGTAAPAQLPIATVLSLGVVEPDGTTIGITAPGVISILGGAGTVSQIVAGTNITVSPAGGTGIVTINATGGGSSLDFSQVFMLMGA